MVAFVLGSIPTGVMVARRHGVDLRAVGSGNVGATNVARALGRRWATMVLVLDVAKGFAPAWLARHFSEFVPSWVPAAAGFMAVAGHVFSIFLKGRGGKGVATALGAALGLEPLCAVFSFGVYAILFAAFRISSVGSLGAVVAFPIAIALYGRPGAHGLAFALLVGALVIARHRENLTRLFRGKELKA